MNLDALAAFVTTIELGSMVRAATSLGVPRATLRARIEGLEADLSVQLLVRNHRGVEPTLAGARLLVGARDLLADAERLARSAQHEQEGVLGELVLRVPVGLPPLLAGLFNSELQRRYPQISVTVFPVCEPLREDGPEADLILHFGDRPATGEYRTFTLRDVQVRLQASSAYLEVNGVPGSVDELARHRLLSWLISDKERQSWPLLAGGRVPIRPSAASPDAYALYTMAAMGLGIALIPRPRSGAIGPMGEELVELLPRAVGCDVPLRVSIPERRARTGRRKAVTALLREVASAFGLPDLQEDPGPGR